ncbi:disease resistance protein RPV1-like [Cryptomeria japonica]|uniref:disease resistance protein RPV1-like n=1 Tax=Cryptomeria japonica TaxID=3369 RepID=UPI0027DA0F1C|nr:disease resistance protein RPV1-like [Cryptomeria japonica]
MLKTGTPIIPIFYHVQRAHLRHLKGNYESSFTEYQEKGRYVDKFEEWKKALYNVSFYEGEIVNDNEYATQLSSVRFLLEEQKQKQRVLKNIVNRVLKIMKRGPLEVATHPVGLKEAVAEFEMKNSESAKNHSNVQLVGIWGMGGSGKTTLAKELYNKKCSSIEKSSFVFDVRTAASKNELHIKQRQLLEDFGFKFSDQPFDNIEQGKMILSNYLTSLPVFIILDDVDHRDQLEILLPGKASLASGSLIIVTTRDKEVLKVCGISCIYVMKSMNQSHAKQRFCWHAFLKSSPLSGFEDLVEKFVCASNGLPLSLKVLGGQLHGWSNKDLWEDVLHKISRILPDDIINRLRVRYDALDKEEQQMFLDVACFFIGKNKTIAISVWEGSGWSGLWGWERLVNKCLVEVIHKNEIRMHDHLRDLGREIARTLVPHRLWSPNQLTLIIKQEEIRGMILNPANNDVHNFPNSFLNTSIWLRGFKMIRRAFPYGLKILVIEENSGNNLHIAKLSRELAWLSCTRITHRNHPSWLRLKNLRVLELYDCPEIVGLWKDGVERCEHLTLQSDILENMTKLQYLNLNQCTQLEELPRHITNQVSLSELYLEGTRLRGLPINIGQLSKLRVMEICPDKGCFHVQSFPDSMGSLTLLEQLSLRNLKVLSLPKSLKQLINLWTLKIVNCPMGELDFGQTFLGNNLKKIELGETSVSKITISKDCCPHLKILTLYCNNYLTEVNTLPTTVEDILIENCRLLRKISGIGGIVSLQYLWLRYCPNLEKLPRFDKLVSLKVFRLGGRNKVETIQGLQHCTSLERLEIDGGKCWEVSDIESWENVQRLTSVQLIAKKKSAVLPCIQTIQKWPEDITIFTKAVAGAGSFLSSQAFPKLSVVHSFANEEIISYNKNIEFELLNHPSDGNAMMLCLVIKRNSFMRLNISWRNDRNISAFRGWDMEEGKWTWIGVFTQHSECLAARKWCIYGSIMYGECEVEKGMVVRGDEESVVKGFHRLLTLLAC